MVLEAVDALLNGPGYYVIPNALDQAKVEEANSIINDHTKICQ